MTEAGPPDHVLNKITSGCKIQTLEITAIHNR